MIVFFYIYNNLSIEKHLYYHIRLKSVEKTNIKYVDIHPELLRLITSHKSVLRDKETFYRTQNCCQCGINASLF